MQLIASRDNSFLKHIRRLLASSAARREARETLLDGPHLVSAYLNRRPSAPMQIAVARSKFELPEIRALVERAGDAQFVMVEDALFKAISPSETPAGIVALIPVPISDPMVAVNCLLLEGIQDPGNMGSMLRTALAAGFLQIYLSAGCADPWSPKCLRGGMGAQFGLCISEDAILEDVLEQFPGISIACDPHTPRSLYDLALPSPLAVLIGAEGLGLSAPLLSVASHRCRIPMSKHTESLNVGAAAAVVMYEHVRQHLASASDSLSVSLATAYPLAPPTRRG